MKLRTIVTFGLLLLAFTVGLAAIPSQAADHLDAPGLTSPGNDGRLDINDLYAFKNGDNTVLIMTVNPAAGVFSPDSFNDDASYQFKIDTNGDAREELTYKISFEEADDDFIAANGNSAQDLPNNNNGARDDDCNDDRIEANGNAGEDATSNNEASRDDDDDDDCDDDDDDMGRQKLTIRCTPASRCGGHGAKLGSGLTGETITLNSGGMAYADLFDDPFFFDLNAFLGSYPFCEAPGGTPGSSGADFFAGLNVSAIVLEVPSNVFGTDNIGIWVRTVEDGDQIDRMGRPAINTVFIPSDFKNDFNEGKPRRDQRDFSQFLGPFADLLLPDILTVDTSSGAGFLNGRQLADDVIDIELQLITGDPNAGDCVDANDIAFPGSFPYLAPAH